MAQDNNKSADIDFNSENIFDDFTESEEIKEDVQKFEENEARDAFFYLKKLNSALFSLNIVVFIGIVITVLYIFVQTGTTKKPYDFLNPICGVFLGDISSELNTCYGVSSVLEEYTGKLDDIKKEQANKVLPLLGEAYSIENFNLSKKVSFLLDKTNSRLKPLEIIAAFDALKSTFAPIDKSEISCYDMLIREGNILEITCDSFSPDWDSRIVDLDNGNITFVSGGGTAISRASSFIYFLDNYAESPFTVIKKPEKLSALSIQSGPYTQKVTMQLELQYNNSEDLSF